MDVTENSENSKQMILISKMKYNQFLSDISNGNYIEKKIRHLSKIEFEEIFSDILILSNEQFLSQIKNGISLSLSDIYSQNCLSHQKVIILIESCLQLINSEYINLYNTLSKAWLNHEKNLRKKTPLNEEMLKIFRKHCINNDEYAYHNCDLKNNTFLVIYENSDIDNNNNKINYVICLACKKVYYSSFIQCHCNKCNVDYFTSVLSPEENMDLLPATWDNYHCPQIINEKMKCIKCREIFYLNMKNNMLTCLNKNCGCISKPSRILWTCTVCKKEFKSGCIPYNPLDLTVIKKVIRQTLLLKHLAHPNKMPCCKLNVFFTNFYHKNSCKGILYVGELNGAIIIVCDKCHAINFYDRFIWTCPQCGKRFRDKIKINNKNQKNNENLIDKNSNSNNNIINENTNDQNDKKLFYRNLISNRNIHKSIKNEIMINNNNTININNNIISDSPKRKKLKDIKSGANNNNNSGYFNFDSMKNILKLEQNSQTIENNKVSGNNEIKRERTNYFHKYKEKKEKEKKEKEEKEKKEKEEKNFEYINKAEKEENAKIQNEISERRNFRDKRNIFKSDIYYKKQIDENKGKYKIPYNIAEDNNNTLQNNLLSKESDNINHNNKKRNINYKQNEEEEIEGDDEEEIEEEELENNNKSKKESNKEKINKRKPEGRKTHGHEIKEDSTEEKSIKQSEIKCQIPMSNIAGISEHLLNYINKRMNFILSRSKIPIINIEEYILYKKLGEGSYGVIYSVFKKNEKKLYALKKIIAHTLNEIDEFTKEFELVHSCEHKNIMKIYGICLRILDSTTYALYVLMEYSNGDWDKEIRMHLQQRKHYTEIEMISILYQLTKALLFMQEKLKVSHRDIKPQNILTFNDSIYKLADFGEAKEVKISKQLNTLRGTELYMSPALYDGLKHEKDDVSHNPFKSDVFSLGFCLLYAAALNFNLLYEIRDVTDMKIINKILHKHLRKNYSEKFISIISKMLEIDENNRYDFPSLINDISSYYDINSNE